MAKTKAVNPRGFDCVNVLMQKAIARVKTKAKNRNRMRAKAQADPEANREHVRQWRLDNPDKKKKTDATYHAKNREKNIARMKQYAIDNHDELLVKSNKYQRDRRANDLAFRIGGRLRARLQMFLSDRAPKAGHTYDMIGCGPVELQDHLQKQTTKNIQEGEIDHIFPMTMYNFEDPAQQFKVMHFSNVQPLTIAENRDKTDMLPTKAMAAKVDPSCWPDGVTEDMLPDKYPGWSTALRM